MIETSLKMTVFRGSGGPPPETADLILEKIFFTKLPEG
jgi:hypothetical protein